MNTQYMGSTSSPAYAGSMPKELKEKWLKELRSGEWIQEIGSLHNPETGGFCCLGVLQYIASDGSCEISEYSEPRFASMPSPDWLEENACDFGDAEQEYSCPLNVLAGMNDDFQDNRREEDGFIPDSGNFAEIADWIETNIEGV